MNYPLISEYIEAIKAAEDNFQKLANLRPVLTDDGQPVMTSGNFAVVFKMEDMETGKFYALKCFTKEQEGRMEAYHQIADALKDVDSPYLVSLRYLDKELFVDTEQTAETEFPVLLMDWVEGKTLDKYLRENLDDKYALEMLAYRFSQLAQWLIPQPFAHGDMKPDNILVREDGILVLVDYDGMYVPAMKGQKARELGSPDFRHPLRTEDDFDEHIDDFPCISILLSLKAIAVNKQLWEYYGSDGRLLFTEYNYCYPHNCSLLLQLYPSMDNYLNILIGLFNIALVEGELSHVSHILLRLKRPEIESMFSKEDESTMSMVFSLKKLADFNAQETCMDSFGSIYSRDKHLLLKGANINVITIDPRVQVICSEAFQNCKELEEIRIPSGLLAVGERAFQECSRLHKIILPNSTTFIGRYAFEGCAISGLGPYSLNKINSIWEGTFSNCYNIGSLPIWKCVTHINNKAFFQCNLEDISIPETVKIIEGNPFAGNPIKSIKSYSPHYVVYKDALYSYDMKHLVCVYSVREIFDVPEGVETINSFAFYSLDNLRIVNLPKTLRYMNNSFVECEKLKEVTINSRIVNRENEFFVECNNLESIKVPMDMIGWYLTKFSGLLQTI